MTPHMSYDAQSVPASGRRVLVRPRTRSASRSPVGVPTPLHNVNAAGQFHRDVQSFMVPSLAHDTTHVIRCPICTRQRPSRT